VRTRQRHLAAGTLLLLLGKKVCPPVQDLWHLPWGVEGGAGVFPADKQQKYVCPPTCGTVTTFGIAAPTRERPNK